MSQNASAVGAPPDSLSYTPIRISGVISNERRGPARGWGRGTDGSGALKGRQEREKGRTNTSFSLL